MTRRAAASMLPPRRSGAAICRVASAPPIGGDSVCSLQTKTAPVCSGAVCVTLSCIAQRLALPKFGAALGHRQHDHLGADVDAGVEVGDVVIGQADAAGGDVLADGVGGVGAVDAVDGATEIHGAGAKRVAGAAG